MTKTPLPIRRETYIQVFNAINKARSKEYMSLLNGGYEILSQRLLDGDIEETIFMKMSEPGLPMEEVK